MRRLALLLPLLLVLWMGAGLRAQRVVSARPAEVLPVHLGPAAVTLRGPWRFHLGDDPRWAQVSLDDSRWEQVDLGGTGAPQEEPDDGGDLVPGWTAQGHPGQAGFAWYRLRIDISDAPGSLALRMPGAVDDAYQIFVNGKKIGQFGDFDKGGVRAYAALPRGFALPAALHNGPVLIAIRVWMDSATRYIAPDVGGLRSAPVLGLARTVAGQVRLDWDEQAHFVGSGFLETLVLLLALVITLAHFAQAREEKAYLWLALVVLITLMGNIILQVVNFTTWIPQTPAILLRDVVLAPMRMGLWVLFWASWFGLGTPRRVWQPTAALVFALAAITAMLRPPLHGQVVSLQAGSFLTPATLCVKLALACLLLAVAVAGIRRNRTEGLLALPVVLLAAVANYQHDLRFLHIPITFLVFGFQVSLGQISTMLSLLLITAMGARRFLRTQRQQVQWELEVQQARELQQVIIPQALPQVPGFHIEGDYRPSREVGGDFFQVIPNRDDGSVLVLLGDVTGKGLRAGMLVALIVGAADAAARENSAPEHLLQTLNERLCERGYASATCLAMRITADGFTSIANAGHLPPYLNGRELVMEGALPLGTLPGLDFTMTQLWLQPGDKLMLMTDGVVEAQDEAGELLGFDRIGELVAQDATVRQVADVAAQFGQVDDILVLGIERLATPGVRQPAAA